jgi:hypothetical protein
MAQVTVTEAEIGQVIATNSMVHEITLVTVPTDYRSYFTLTDTSQGVEREVFNIDPSTSHVGAGSVLLADGSVYFENLTVKNVPAGTSFLIDYTPPPTLTSISPDTAVAGTDPDFVLSCVGTDFTHASVIYFGQEDEPTTFVSDTEITTGVKPSLFVPDTVPVKVRTGALDTDSVDFTFTAAATE